MKYSVVLNNNYLNSFNAYGEAVALAEKMRKKFPKANVKII